MYVSRPDLIDGALITDRIPDSITDTQFDTWITWASREVDAKVGLQFPVLSSGWKFESPPDTPSIIVQTAAYLVASQALRGLRTVNRQGKTVSASAEYYGMAQANLAGIRDKKIDVYGNTGADLDSDEESPVFVQARPSASAGGFSLDLY